MPIWLFIICFHCLLVSMLGNNNVSCLKNTCTHISMWNQPEQIKNGRFEIVVVWRSWQWAQQLSQNDVTWLEIKTVFISRFYCCLCLSGWLSNAAAVETFIYITYTWYVTLKEFVDSLWVLKLETLNYDCTTFMFSAHMKAHIYGKLVSPYFVMKN